MEVAKQPTLIDRMLNLAKKIYYDSVFNVKIVLNSEKNHRAWILGRQYRKKKDIEAAISNIVWLTYREHISGKLVQSDVGWGCMIRVGQMLLAETFRRHLKYNEQQNRQQLLNILSAFIDDDEGLEHVGNYSIQKIAKEAMEEYKMHVGQWHSPSSISYCLQTLHYRNPLRGTQTIKIHVSQSALLYDSAVKELSRPTNSMLIILLCMLGIDSVEPSKIASIKTLQTNSYFNGMIGGIPKRAYYFVGHTEDNFIYLDPHIVHQGSNRGEIEINLNTFFCNYTLSLKSSKVHPSMGICFYVRNQAELDDLFQNLYTMKKNGLQLPFSFMKNYKEAYQPNKSFVKIIEVTNNYSDSEEEEETYISELNNSYYSKSMVFEELSTSNFEEIKSPERKKEMRKGSDFQELEHPVYNPNCNQTSLFEVVPLDWDISQETMQLD